MRGGGGVRSTVKRKCLEDCLANCWSTSVHILKFLFAIVAHATALLDLTFQPSYCISAIKSLSGLSSICFVLFSAIFPCLSRSFRSFIREVTQAPLFCSARPLLRGRDWIGGLRPPPPPPRE